MLDISVLIENRLLIWKRVGFAIDDKNVPVWIRFIHFHVLFSFNEEMDPPSSVSFVYLFSIRYIFYYCKEWSNCCKPTSTVDGSAKKPCYVVILSTIRGQTDKKRNWLQFVHSMNLWTRRPECVRSTRPDLFPVLCSTKATERIAPLLPSPFLDWMLVHLKPDDVTNHTTKSPQINERINRQAMR